MATHIQELPGSPLPSVSVILPVLNEERHLESAVLSILSQDYRGIFEVILAIGPSRDRTEEIAAKLVASDSRVVIIQNPTGRTAAGLNLALKKSANPVVSKGITLCEQASFVVLTKCLLVIVGVDTLDKSSNPIEWRDAMFLSEMSAIF